MTEYRQRRYIVAMLSVLALLLAGCQGAGPGADATTEGTDHGFDLAQVLDGYMPTGTAGELGYTAVDDGRSVTVTVTAAGAEDLTALYFDLNYDPASYSLAAAGPAPGFSAGGEVLSLYHVTGDGTVHYGQVLAGLDPATGFSGDGAVAEFRFRQGAEPTVKGVAGVPVADLSAVPLSWDSETGTLTWDYYHQGDYNQDGLVTVSDLTPLGVHYDTAGPFDKATAISCVDGNRDGYITVSDITPIGANYDSQVSGYYVFASDDPDDDYPQTPSAQSQLTALGAQMMDDALGDKSSERLSFAYTVGSPVAGDSYWVRPVAGADEGVPSNIVNDSQWRAWDRYEVDSAGEVGYYLSMDLDSNDYPHICYFDQGGGNLMYSRFNGLNWQKQTVDNENNTGWFCAIAVDSQDVVHIAYRDDTLQDLKYATNPSGDWELETVDSEGNVGQFTDIAVDSADHPCIAYIDEYPEGNLYYASHDGSAWSIQTVDDSGDMQGYTCLALDSTDQPHIAYNRPDRLMYAYWDGAAWQSGAVRWFDVGKFSSIALDSDDHPHLTCFNEWTREGKYSAWDGTEWRHSTFDSDGDTGWCTCIQIGPDDLPVISFTEAGNGELRLATVVDNHWSIEVVDSAGDTGYSTSLKLDSQGVPHIAYADRGNDDVVYTTY